MKLAENIKPTSYLKDHVEEIVYGLGENPETFVITQDGQPKAVLQDIESFERTQETLKLLKILAIGRRQVEEGKVRPVEDVLAEMRRRMGEKNG
ncbi:MAG: type II toxin-antitoxin system Phd/YefM family antitoxin [Planctomycetaceae bacterium]|nr:type II toxin-antitoxin system Phd/YefM family antitoxin [Planctomycetaceae bacterium]